MPREVLLPRTQPIDGRVAPGIASRFSAASALVILWPAKNRPPHATRELPALAGDFTISVSLVPFDELQQLSRTSIVTASLISREVFSGCIW